MYIFEFNAYIALFALHVRSFKAGANEPFLFMVIPKYLYSSVFSKFWLFIVNWWFSL